MVQEEHQAVEDAKSQISVLRQRNADLNEKNFMAELDRRNLEVKVKELGEVMKELNLQTLMSHKQTNEKNTHLLTDSLQKLDSAVVPFTLSRNLQPFSSTAPSAMNFQ